VERLTGLNPPESSRNQPILDGRHTAHIPPVCREKGLKRGVVNYFLIIGRSLVRVQPGPSRKPA
jgi:hypothetical protein